MKRDTFWSDLERTVIEARARMARHLEELRRMQAIMGGLANLGVSKVRPRRRRVAKGTATIKRVIKKHRESEGRPTSKDGRKKRTFSAAARTRLSKAAKRRWAAAKKAGKKRLG